MSGISRRQALAGLGSISVGALIAACSDDDDSSALDPETNTGTTAEVEPKTSSGHLASQFDDAAACRQTAEETEGPFYFDVDKIRSDIREDRDGTTLRLGVRVRDAAECKPIANAVVDV
jgi:protocatechuate 3,4-dioxygenase beta subunit